MSTKEKKLHKRCLSKFYLLPLFQSNHRNDLVQLKSFLNFRNFLNETYLNSTENLSFKKKQLKRCPVRPSFSLNNLVSQHNSQWGIIIKIPHWTAKDIWMGLPLNMEPRLFHFQSQHCSTVCHWLVKRLQIYCFLYFIIIQNSISFSVNFFNLSLLLSMLMI